MDRVFITDLTIEKVRHLENIEIPLSKDELKHLIITGKNGSGKTSVLDAMATFMDNMTVSNELVIAQENLEIWQKHLNNLIEQNSPVKDILINKKSVECYKKELESAKNGEWLCFNISQDDIYDMFQNGLFILAYYKADRVFQAQIPEHVEKIQLEKYYVIRDVPRLNFVKYLLDLKMTEALAATGGKTEKAAQIKAWFENLQNLLRDIFEADSLTLEFDEETFLFSIREPGKEPFGFNELSSGYAAVLDIVADIMMRMESQTNRTFRFDIPGIVLIDEIETHLHLELQKKILPFLTAIFPNIQFIVTTHSPFILNSLENAVIYDLQNHSLVKNGLADIPYDGIVEGYFRADKLSASLKEKFQRYKTLVQKNPLSDEDFAEIARLELFLEEIPDYLALDIATEYRKLKLDFESREDV